ncbi:hypothetical protein [Chelativorans sp. AA-79]|uniref:hypothetical protein n=1 Tax=Chelativorans sp. AA-79 TaxID=3028735 RepID=UPI0023F7D360|nr:hypothetical protein [Chelativorans sp. AA-79]WEX07522.1 hypothetical protein PVE73_15510 [Chelativorans sp. AA-79]
MLSRWFIADQTQMGLYRLKRPAVRPFWDWVASWACCVSKPSDLGFSDDGFEMPALNLHRHLVAADRGIDTGEEKDGQIRLFRTPDMSATSIHREKRLTSQARARRLAEIVSAEPGEPWIIWVETDYDADAVREAIPEAVEIRGSMPIEKKEERLEAFSRGEIRILLYKPSICGFGVNWQYCARMAFMGLSYESFYGAVRRCWRFRQKRAVDVHVVCADTEEAIWQVVSRKAGDHDATKAEMASAMSRPPRHRKSFKATHLIPHAEALDADTGLRTVAQSHQPHGRQAARAEAHRQGFSRLVCEMGHEGPNEALRAKRRSGEQPESRRSTFETEEVKRL